MRTSKLFLFAAAFVLLISLSAGAMAQGVTGLQDSFRMPPEPIEPIVTLNAIEITDGTLGMDNATKKETAFGYAFLGRTTGSLPGSFTLSMNCTIPLSGETSNVTGGTWTLPVYVPGIKGDSIYAGSLYGTIAKGSMSWDKERTGSTVYIVLNIDGGTEAWDGASGYASFTGTLSIDEKTQKTILNGDMVFTIINAVVE